MFRVITQHRDGGTRPVVEHGPWHPDRDTANFWADLLRMQGYVVEVEDQNNLSHGGQNNGEKEKKNDNADLAAALAAMA